MSRVGGSVPDGLASGSQVIERLSDQPGGPELLALAAEHEQLMLIGGAVRDLMLGRAPRELDIVVPDGAADLASELASRVGALAQDGSVQRSQTAVHERFHTALVSWSDGQIDIATRRSESYAEPGALPEVSAGTVEQDLHRRDFTVNAIAIELGGPGRGTLHAAEHGLEDLAARRLRVLHDASFLDDPTRLLRLARYRARLGFEIEPHTAELAGKALQAGAPASVSRSRLGAELRLALGESDALAALVSIERLGALGAIHPALRLDVAVAERALELSPAEAHPDVLLMASLLLGDEGARGASLTEAEMFALLDGLELTASARDRIIRSAVVAPSLVASMQDAGRPSGLHCTLASEPLEAIALAGALAPPGSASEHAARSWLGSLRNVRLAIGGEDLLAAGIPAGPEIGRRLAAALAAKLDGEIQGAPEEELAVALERDA